MDILTPIDPPSLHFTYTYNNIRNKEHKTFTIYIQ